MISSHLYHDCYAVPNIGRCPRLEAFLSILQAPGGMKEMSFKPAWALRAKKTAAVGTFWGSGKKDVAKFYGSLDVWNLLGCD